MTLWPFCDQIWYKVPNGNDVCNMAESLMIFHKIEFIFAIFEMKIWINMSNGDYCDYDYSEIFKKIVWWWRQRKNKLENLLRISHALKNNFLCGWSLFKASETVKVQVILLFYRIITIFVLSNLQSANTKLVQFKKYINLKIYFSCLLILFSLNLK